MSFFTDQGVIFCSQCGELAETDPESRLQIRCPNGHGEAQLELNESDDRAHAQLPDDAQGEAREHVEVPPEPEP